MLDSDLMASSKDGIDDPQTVILIGGIEDVMRDRYSNFEGCISSRHFISVAFVFLQCFLNY